ncbi:MAG: tetratricopeptide repeat protein [Candidatus Obscuribacterales bacterium]|nr:tetratricopeptide repeat protein [Candidatus Obscuribacterales bacterium]
MLPVKKRRSWIILAVIFAISQPAAFAAGTTEMEQGLHHLKVKDFRAAAGHFRHAALLKPDDPLASYYLANCLVHLKRHPEAIIEYRRSYKIDPFSEVSDYCRQALLSYSEVLPALTGPKSQFINQPVKEASRQHVDQAVSNIRRQAASEKFRSHQYAESLAENAIKAGDFRARKIQEEAELEIQDILTNGTKHYDRNDRLRWRGARFETLSHADQELVKEQIEAIQRRAAEKIKEERLKAQELSGNYKTWAEGRKESLDSVADNLETQFVKGKVRNKGVALDPVGTGLYVRNYLVSDKNTPPPRVRSAVVRILDYGSNIDTADCVDSNDSNKDVKAKVLD